jgi:hypothetical protein
MLPSVWAGGASSHVSTGPKFPEQVNYTLAEHRHRFAAWAAARARQRGFTSTAVLVAALETSGLREFIAARDRWPTTREAFDKWHIGMCRRLLKKLPETATYGRAAKLLAVYIKAQVVCGGHHDTALARHAHPPIDRILLNALATKRRKELGDLGRKAWTTFDEETYRLVLERVRSAAPEGAEAWRVEFYWAPAGD